MALFGMPFRMKQAELMPTPPGRKEILEEDIPLRGDP